MIPKADHARNGLRIWDVNDRTMLTASYWRFGDIKDPRPRVRYSLSIWIEGTGEITTPIPRDVALELLAAITLAAKKAATQEAA